MYNIIIFVDKANCQSFAVVCTVCVHIMPRCYVGAARPGRQ